MPSVWMKPQRGPKTPWWQGNIKTIMGIVIAPIDGSLTLPDNFNQKGN